jgi:ribonuclease HII
MNILLQYDEDFRSAHGVSVLAGVDEAGRGPLAGDVYAAAVILPNGLEIPELSALNDSKKLSAKKREMLFDVITQKAVSLSVGVATIAEIEEINILNAAMLAMKRAVDSLSIPPEFVLVDGNKLPPLGELPAKAIIKGDGTSACIAAASVVAKVTRDRVMVQLDKQYPEYEFAKHKGYGTKLHYEKIRQYGISPVHRKSFLKNIILSEFAHEKSQ